MINFTLYKQSLKATYKILLIFMLVLCMYISIIVTMFDPELGNALDEFSRSMPEMMAMFGMEDSGSTLTGFLSSYLYGMIMLVFPFVFTIIVTNNLVARHVDRGSMAYLLAAPHSRNKVIFTQMMVYITMLVTMIIFATVLGIIMSELYFPGDLETGEFIMLNVGVLCLQFAISGICFFASCISNETRICLSISAGITVLAYLIQMLANMGGKLENLKYATFFTLYNTDKILAGDSEAYIMMGILLISGLVLYCAAIYVFNKRDLPI